jgi:hypothetical protein
VNVGPGDNICCARRCRCRLYQDIHVYNDARNIFGTSQVRLNPFDPLTIEGSAPIINSNDLVGRIGRKPLGQITAYESRGPANE